MTHGERPRWTLATIGVLMFQAASFMPIFGGAAKWAVRCKGRAFTGNFDDCFNDHLPIVEMIVPLLALVILYPFARLTYTLFAPKAELRTLKWRPALGGGADFFPAFHIIAGLGALWAVWRASTYPLDPVTAPYIAFWTIFALWFVLGVTAAWPEAKD